MVVCASLLLISSWRSGDRHLRSTLPPVEYHSLIVFFHVHEYRTVEHDRMPFMLHVKVIYIWAHERTHLSMYTGGDNRKWSINHSLKKSCEAS